MTCLKTDISRQNSRLHRIILTRLTRQQLSVTPYRVQSKVDVIIYNMLGGKVATLVNGIQQAGFKEVKWNALNSAGNNVASGIYFYLVKFKGKVEYKKMILIK